MRRLLLLAFVVLVIAGLFYSRVRPSLRQPSRLPLPTPTPWVLPTVGPVPTPTPTAVPLPTPTSEAVIRGQRNIVGSRPLPDSMRLLIPSIGVDAPIVPVGLDANGAMGSPARPDVVGWLASGPLPAEQGNVLLAGHLDWAGPPSGPAVFYRLENMLPGQEVIAVVDGRRSIYVVRETVRIAWDDPAQMGFLGYRPTPVLTLITCGGVFDRGAQNYSHRVIVVAEIKVGGG